MTLDGSPSDDARQAGVTGYVTLLSIASFLYTGYAVYHNNQDIQIPLVHLLNDPSYYPDDPFVATLPYYSSLLWQVVAWASRIVPLEPLLLGLFLAERVLVIYAAGAVARTFLPTSRLARIGAMALFALAPGPAIGGGTIVTNYLEQTGLCVAPFLLAIASFHRRAPIRWAVYTALGFNLNSMYGAYALTYFAASFLIDQRYRRAWRLWLPALLVFTVIAAPGIVLTLSAFRRWETDPHVWLVAAHARFPHHLYPFTWKAWDYVRFVALTVTLVAALRRFRPRLGSLFLHGTVWTAVGWLWLAFGFAAAYLVESPAVLVMHPGRGPDLWHAFAGIALVCVAALSADTAEATTGRVTPGRDPGWKMALGLYTVVLVCLTSAGPYAIATAALLFIVVMWREAGQGDTDGWEAPGRLCATLTAWVCAAGCTALIGRTIGSRSLADALITRPEPEVAALARWAENQTPTGATFLVEPNDTGSLFRVLAKRSVFVTWKDGSALLWDRTFAQTWVERIELLGADLSMGQARFDDRRPTILRGLSTGYANLSDDDVAALAARFGIDYWVARTDRQSSYPAALVTARYAVRRLPTVP